MSGFGFLPNEGFFGAGATPGTPMLQTQILRDAARKYLATHGDIPVGKSDVEKIREAINIANTWVENCTQFPLTTTNSDVAWSRRDWLDSSITGWQKLVEPLAEGMVSALTKVLTEMGPQFGSTEIADPDFIENSGTSNFGVDAFLPVMRGFMGQLIATQLGQSIGALSVSITGSNDVAIPLFENPGARLIPQNVAAWGAGLEIPEQEIAIYLALREVSAQRLFAHTPWLSQYIRDLITAYGKGITVDIQSIQQQAETAMSSGELDITNPESINLAINQGMFQPEQSPAQAAALGKLEITLALIEGWIDHITTLSAAERLPSLSALQETQRRSRIESAPTQQLFASLLGLEVSPRKMRECANFWNEIYKISADSGIEIRDHRWEDPSLLPTSDDLADPAAFLASTTVPDDLSGLI